MHGGELIRRARDRWPNVKVLVMSGYAEDEALRRGVLHGEVIFLQKPFGAAVLERELRAALGCSLRSLS
jgi:CheY-like chemotaxis protein